MSTIKGLRFAAVLLAALTLGMKLAHVLELPPKLAWTDGELYLTVQTSLYQVFGTLGPIVDVGAILAAFALAFLLRRTPAFRITLAGAICFVLSMLVWLLVVAPANPHFAEFTATGAVPADWMNWRAQWQYGQAGSFVFDLLGFCALVWSLIRETSA